MKVVRNGLIAFLFIISQPVLSDSDQSNETFVNPGGMWPPSLLGVHRDTLAQLGCHLNLDDLLDPLRAPLSAVVSLGGCSGSFISPNGLIVTNHHCVTAYLQHNSTIGRNLLKDGFLARGVGEELSAGPSARVFVTQALTDVSDRILAIARSIQDPLKRQLAIEAEQKKIVKECEKDRPSMRCDLAGFFYGTQFILIEKQEIRDVRLVHAPQESIGNFGGEIDNWSWPRHTGDYSFLRAYVAPDGSSAPYSKDNVPFKPKHFLKISPKGLDPYSFAMMAGYPGRTNRLVTAKRVQEEVEWNLPTTIEEDNESIAILEELSKDPGLEIKVKKRLKGLWNYRTNFQETLAALKERILNNKLEDERGFRAWIAADRKRVERYGDIIDKMDALRAQYEPPKEQAWIRFFIHSNSDFLGVATDLVRWNKEKQKPDLERETGFQDRNLPQMIDGQKSLTKTIDKRVDRPFLVHFLKKGVQFPREQWPDLLYWVLGMDEKDTQPITDTFIEARVDSLLAASELTHEKLRLQLVQSSSYAEISKSEDPFIQIALRHVESLEKRIENIKRYTGELILVAPLYVEALRGYRQGRLAPDANSTVRVAYGTVRGAKQGSGFTFPFTRVTEMAAKHTGQEPFNAPARLLELIQQRKFGRYGNAMVDGEVPLNIMSDLDGTGGNSGSATLDADGNLVGLLFDTAKFTLGKDWFIAPGMARSIHVDIRYVLWLLDYFENADELLREIGIEPEHSQ